METEYFDLLDYYDDDSYLIIMYKHIKQIKNIKRTHIAKAINVPLTTYRSLELDDFKKNKQVLFKALQYLDINTNIKRENVEKLNEIIKKKFYYLYYSNYKTINKLPLEKEFIDVFNNSIFEYIYKSIEYLLKIKSRDYRLDDLILFLLDNKYLLNIINNNEKIICSIPYLLIYSLKKDNNNYYNLLNNLCNIEIKDTYLKGFMYYVFSSSLHYLHDYNKSIYYVMKNENILILHNNYFRLGYLKHILMENYYQLENYNGILDEIDNLINWAVCIDDDFLLYYLNILKINTLLKINKIVEIDVIMKYFIDNNIFYNEVILIIHYLNIVYRKNYFKYIPKDYKLNDDLENYLKIINSKAIKFKKEKDYINYIEKKYNYKIISILNKYLLQKK